MARTFLLALNIAAAVCMIVAVPVLLTFLLGLAVLEGARVVNRKIKHRQSHCIRTRRKARPDLYPEAGF